MPMQYVCAFRGRRDSYQAPLALAEGGMLDQFITDAYAMPWLRTVASVGPAAVTNKVDFRFEKGIPLDRVKCLWGTTVVEHVRHRLGFAPMLTFSRLDGRFSRAASRRAAKSRSHLFLYSPYAWEAFTTRYLHEPRKVLFQYHPHHAMESRILAEDSRRFPRYGESYSGSGGELTKEPLVRRERDAWRYADLIICASTFTKRSLLEAGADERRCRVIPYGIDLLSDSGPRPATETFRALFVGSGGQRKGLHHLLLAWQQAKLPRSSTLTLVCRVIDREIERLALQTPQVTIVGGTSQDGLRALYGESSVFVMPSLVEGFGQVFLEALAEGCPVVGTANTCLPDVGGESDGIFIVNPGQTEELAATLERLAARLPLDQEIRRAASDCASRFSWKAFREGLRQAITN